MSGILTFSCWLCGRDEELLGQGLELNDSLQSLLAKHDAIASGSPLPILLTNSSPQPTEVRPSSPKPSEGVNSRPRDSSQRPNAIQPTLAITRAQLVEEEEEEDEFAQLARRLLLTPHFSNKYFLGIIGMSLFMPVLRAHAHWIWIHSYTNHPSQ